MCLVINQIVILKCYLFNYKFKKNEFKNDLKKIDQK